VSNELRKERERVPLTMNAIISHYGFLWRMPRRKNVSGFPRWVANDYIHMRQEGHFIGGGGGQQRNLDSGVKQAISSDLPLDGQTNNYPSNSRPFELI
jgi:hypothetical protein